MSTEAAAAVGCPRDPAVDAKVLGAAVALFGEVGRSGFTVDEIAKRASVGKAAIYRRWTAKEDLLVDALSHHLDVVHDVDTGMPRDASVTLIIDTGCGGAINHATTVPAHLREQVRATADASAELLVDFVLSAVDR